MMNAWNFSTIIWYCLRYFQVFGSCSRSSLVAVYVVDAVLDSVLDAVVATVVASGVAAVLVVVLVIVLAAASTAVLDTRDIQIAVE